MAYQTASKILVAARRETTSYSIATVTGAHTVRIIDSPGLELDRAQIQSGEKRSDGLRAMMRLGYKSVTGSYNAEISVGGATDMFLEAIQRGVWATATAIAFASVTSVTTGTNTVVAAGGDWVGSQNVRVGDVFYLTNHSTSANNNVNARVTAVSSLTITVATGTFVVDAVADATGTLNFLKKLKSPATPTAYTHSIEQYDTDIDLSEVFLGCMCVGVKFSFKPGAMATVQYTFLGTDRQALASGASPYFTSPTLTTSLQLVADDSAIRYNGASVATFTGFDLDFTLTAKGEPVIGSLTTPQIFDNDLTVSGSVTGLRTDFSNLTLYDAETEFDLSILLQEPTGTPKAALGIFLPRVKISKLSAPVGGGDGAKIETLQLAMGPKDSAAGYDASICTFHSSAA